MGCLPLWTGLFCRCSLLSWADHCHENYVMPRQPEPHACRSCRQHLDQPGKPDTGDCGGDCVRCMADYLDPDALETMRKVEPDNPKWNLPVPQ